MRFLTYTVCLKTVLYPSQRTPFCHIYLYIFYTVFQADASLGMLEREYLHESLSYVLRIQDVQERIKFEFVEIILRFISRWLTFYHVGHEVSEDAKEYMLDLQYSVQKVS